ncbi:MAG: hypothetical protein ICV69_13510 [Thermoleophilaceae bacterium]|nr:hypothetical protein [Thermoleophilaceae bacterium]
MDAVRDGDRASSGRRRVAAALALALGAVTLGGAMLALTRDLPAGLTMVGALAAALVLVWQGAVRGGAARILAFGGSLLAVATALVVLAVSNQVLELVVLGTGAILAAAAVRVALLPRGRAGGAWAPVAPPRRPVLLINPRSGGGKAERLAIADVARARGINPVVLAPGGDLTALAAPPADPNDRPQMRVRDDPSHAPPAHRQAPSVSLLVPVSLESRRSFEAPAAGERLPRAALRSWRRPAFGWKTSLSSMTRTSSSGSCARAGRCASRLPCSRS